MDARLVFSRVVFCAPEPDAQTYMTASEFCVLPETQADERHLFLVPNWRRCQGTLAFEWFWIEAGVVLPLVGEMWLPLAT